MAPRKWQTSEEVFRLFRSIGRASLLYDIQDSHSGNMAMRWRNEAGEEMVVITATGSQKGDLEPNHLCYLSTAETDFGYYKASSETDIHVRILSIPGVQASMHAHCKEVVMATLDDRPAPKTPPPFVPVDPLAFYHLGPEIPVDWFAVPSGSPEMAKTIPTRLAEHPLTIIYGHGAMTRGRSLKEAFYNLCLANNAGYIVRLLERQTALKEVSRLEKPEVRVRIFEHQDEFLEKLRGEIRSAPERHFHFRPAPYNVEIDGRCDFPEEEEILKEFRKAGNRIFESRLSPFHTGSMSVRGVDYLLYAPQASMPYEVGGALLKPPLAPQPGDDRELELHKKIYAGSDFQTIMHCYVPEAEAHAHYVYPGENQPLTRIIPVDAEGSFMYLAIPVVGPEVSDDELIRLLHDYKMVVVRGGGVWAVGSQSLSEVLHHPSSLREICLYRIAAIERGLDLRSMEPEKGRRW
ncbi:MAG: L-fuculose phosphate aldolase [Candidatus Saccharicenans subterraneus]|uniref:L-fuculose phosphate aldolase n=1 Tax=Candidatus Saccharicenans subterraneus TaxID=2508984 RepID=A0A3E2BNN4_9BACT|nr:MAG: L-fuculose phosphate aldolase [Candidatus Saccharicenans subterraneum]